MSQEHVKLIHTDLTEVLKTILSQEDGAIRLVLQKNTGEKFLYPPLDKMLIMKNDKVIEMLDFVVSKGSMNKKQVELLKFCPLCFSYEIIPTEHCTNCGSTNISRGRVIEHFNCGYKNLESLFVSNGGLECARCRRPLLIEGKDYSRGKLMYKCHSCGNLNDGPVVDYHCQKCGEYFPVEELGETLVYQYAMENKQTEMVKSTLRSLESIEENLRGKDYKVKRNAEVPGLSGLKYNVDLFATGSKKNSVLVEAYFFEEKISVDEILRLKALSYDLEAKKTILVSRSPLDEKAELLANYYNIETIVPERMGELTQEQAVKLLQ